MEQKKQLVSPYSIILLSLIELRQSDMPVIQLAKLIESELASYADGNDAEISTSSTSLYKLNFRLRKNE